MAVQVGDRMLVRGHHLGEIDRAGEILEVHGPNGAPPYLVRWTDGHTTTFVPGPDTIVEHPASPAGKTRAR